MALHDFFATLLDRDDFYEKVVANARKGPYIPVWDSFKKLKDYLMERCLEWPAKTVCPILVSLDEVHVLYTHRINFDDESDYTLYSRLKSVISEGVKHDFALISLSTVSEVSTASQVSSLAPSKVHPSSMRVRDDESSLPAPFTELPFDVYINAQPLAPGQATLTSVGSLEFTARFGRPL